MNRPYASDWIIIGDGLQYSKERDLYWYKGRVYDELSARHNGIIGLGAALRLSILSCSDCACTSSMQPCEACRR